MFQKFIKAVRCLSPNHRILAQCQSPNHGILAQSWRLFESIYTVRMSLMKIDKFTFLLGFLIIYELPGRNNSAYNLDKSMLMMLFP